MGRFFTSGRGRYALLAALVGAGSLALMGSSCAPAPTKPPPPENTASADLSVTKTDSPDPVVSGSNLTYTLTVANAGPDDSQNTALSDDVPAGTTFVSVAPDPAFSCTTPQVGGTGTVTCNASGALPSGVSATFTVVVQVNASAPPGLPISNHATVSTDTTDPNPGNNAATEPTSVVGAPADLSMTKSDAPDPVAAGTNLTYTITLHNNGPNAAQNVTMSDAVPAGTTFVSVAPEPALCSTPPPGGTGTVSCNGPGGLPSGVTVTFTLVVHVNAAMPAGSTIANTASSSTSSSDPNLGNNTAAASTTVAAAT
jgi:uncharacterized repeat protein (TIGR01451 family)